MALKSFTARSHYYGRLVQMFLGCKYYGGLIPQVGASPGTDSNTFQRLLDDLFEKPSFLPGRSVVSLFSNNHLVRTGRKGGSTTTASNIWRNNFNFQKGYCCYGRPNELLNRTFRTQSRTMCPHLRPAVAGQLRDATCALDTAADADKAKYRREDHPKVLRIDPATREHFVYDPSDITHYTPLVQARGRRLPIAPLIVALYYDSRLTAGRGEVDSTDFLADFNFSPAEFAAYFDDDPRLAEHAALSAAFPRMLSWRRVAASPVVVPPAPLPGIPAPRIPGSRTRRRTSASTGTSSTSPPAGGFWWDAEQAVQQMLVADGWMVVNKTTFGLGYDLLASKAGTTRHVEVKSSAGRCNPSLTQNEYSEARRLRASYVLAIVEDFDRSKPVVVQWIHDPARISVTARSTQVYSMPRSKWVPHSVGKLR